MLSCMVLAWTHACHTALLSIVSGWGIFEFWLKFSGISPGISGFVPMPGSQDPTGALLHASLAPDLPETITSCQRHELETVASKLDMLRAVQRLPGADTCVSSMACVCVCVCAEVSFTARIVHGHARRSMQRASWTGMITASRIGPRSRCMRRCMGRCMRRCSRRRKACAACMDAHGNGPARIMMLP